MSKAPSRLSRPIPALLFLASTGAEAAFLSGEMLDAAADVVAIAVLIIVPIAVIVLF